MSSPLRANIGEVFLTSQYRVGADDYIALTLIIIFGAFYTLRGILWDVPDPHTDLWFERPQATGSRKEGATSDIGLKLESSVSP
jgi:hypothetical protein